MATIRQIRRRIRSVTSTAKITKAMEMVAASKMRRAQQRALATRPYADTMRRMLAGLAVGRDQAEVLHPFLEDRPFTSALVVHITPDRGLAGGLVANVNRRTAAFALDAGVPVRFVAVGSKGRDFLARSGQQLVAEFVKLGDYPDPLETQPIARVVMEEYLAHRADRVFIAYPLFINTVTQRPEVRRLLPVEPPPASEAVKEVDYIYEPGPEEVLNALLPRYVEMQVYHAVLESAASEQSARMVAMRNATDAANEMIEGLTLTYNKARQEQITRELLDIVGGAAGLEKS